jgi:hypothetical protein
MTGSAAWLAAGLLAASLEACAQGTVYRCGADGRSFSQMPCADGHAVQLVPGPSALAQAEARQVAAREARLAQQLAEERRARDDRRAPRASTRTVPATPTTASAMDDGVQTVSRPSRRAKVPAAAPPASGR